MADAFNSASQAQPSVPEATDPFLNYIHSLVQLVDTFPGKDALRSTAIPFRYEEPTSKAVQQNEQTESMNITRSLNSSTSNENNNTRVTTVTPDSNLTKISHGNQTLATETPLNGTPGEKPLVTEYPSTTHNTVNTVLSRTNSSLEEYTANLQAASETPRANFSTSVNESAIVNNYKVMTTESHVHQTSIEASSGGQNDLFALLGLDKGRVDNMPAEQTRPPTVSNTGYLQPDNTFTYSPLLKHAKQGRNNKQNINVQVVPIQQIAKTTDAQDHVQFGGSLRHHIERVNKDFPSPMLSEFVDKGDTAREVVRVNLRPVTQDRQYDSNQMFISTSVDPFLRFQNSNRQSERIIYNVDGAGKNNHISIGKVQFHSLDNTVTHPTVKNGTSYAKNVSQNATDTNDTMDTVVNATNKTLPFWLSLLNTHDSGIIRGKDGFVSYVGNADEHKQQEIVSKNSIQTANSLPPGLTLLSAGLNKRFKGSKKDVAKTVKNHSNNLGTNYSLPDTFMAGTSLNIVHTSRQDHHVHMTHKRIQTKQPNNESSVVSDNGIRMVNGTSIDIPDSAQSTLAPGINKSASTTSWVPPVNNTIRWNLFVGTPDSVTKKQHLNNSINERRNLFPPVTDHNSMKIKGNRTVLFPPKSEENKINNETRVAGRNKLFPPVQENNIHDKHTGHGSTNDVTLQPGSRLHHPSSHVPNLLFMHPQSRLTSHSQSENSRHSWQSFGRSAARPLPSANHDFHQTVHMDHQNHNSPFNKPRENLQSHSRPMNSKANTNHFSHGATDSKETLQGTRHHGMHLPNRPRVHITNLRIHNQHPQSRKRPFLHMHFTTTAMPVVDKSHARHRVAHIVASTAQPSTTVEAVFEIPEETTTANVLEGQADHEASTVGSTASTVNPTAFHNLTLQEKRQLILQNSTLVKTLKERYYKELLRRLLFRRLLQKKALAEGNGKFKSTDFSEITRENSTHVKSTFSEISTNVPVERTTETPLKVRSQTTELFDLLHDFILHNTTQTTETFSTDYSSTTALRDAVTTESMFSFETLTTETPMFEMEYTQTTETLESQTTSTTRPVTEAQIYKQVSTKEQQAQFLGHGFHNISTKVNQEPRSTGKLTREGMHRLMRTLNLIKALRKAKASSGSKNNQSITVNIAALRKAYEKLKTLKNRNSLHGDLADHSQTTRDPIENKSNRFSNDTSSEKQVTMSALGINTISQSAGGFEVHGKGQSRQFPGHQNSIQQTIRNRNNPLGQKGDPQTNSNIDLNVPVLSETVDLGPVRQRLSKSDIGYMHKSAHASQGHLVTQKATNMPMNTDSVTLDPYADFSIVFGSTEKTNGGLNTVTSKEVSPPKSIRKYVPVKERQQSMGNTNRAGSISPDRVNTHIAQSAVYSPEQLNVNIASNKQRGIGSLSDRIVLTGPGNRKIVFVRKQASGPSTSKTTKPLVESSALKQPANAARNNKFNNSPNDRKTKRTRNIQTRNQYSSLSTRANDLTDRRHISPQRMRTPTQQRTSSTSRKSHQRNNQRNTQRGQSLLRVKSPNNSDKHLFIKHNLNDKNVQYNNNNIRRILSRLLHGYGHGGTGSHDYYGRSRLRSYSNGNNYHRGSHAQQSTSAELQERAAERLEALEEAFEAAEAGEYEPVTSYNQHRRLYRRSIRNGLLKKSLENI